MKSIEWVNNHIRLIDQTKLPAKLVYIHCFKLNQLIEAIKKLAIRGAPALGIAGAMGLALVGVHSKSKSVPQLLKELEKAASEIKASRPTAVNLFWAVDRMLGLAKRSGEKLPALKERLVLEAKKIADEDDQMCKRIGKFGAKLIPPKARILTHCNTGFLATGGIGTALGVIVTAYKLGKVDLVYADETRPLLQGARLTAWELKQNKIPYKVIVDGMAGFLMQRKYVDLVITGADRITSTGDVANKVGTYSLAVLAKVNKIPFYIAAPSSTIDLSLRNGSDIVIEERNPQEVLKFGNTKITPDRSLALNLAFDVTPSSYINAIITEKGIIYPPFSKNLKKVFHNSTKTRINYAYQPA